VIRGSLLPLAAGVLILSTAVVLAWDPTLLERIVQPPALIRAALVGGSVTLGLLLLGRALVRIDESRRPDADRDLGTMVRGIRLTFLAVAVFAAAAGWALGHPLPLIVALVIAGVDVVETSFLLVVANTRRGDRR
jgi:hypothetical protein